MKSKLILSCIALASSIGAFLLFAFSPWFFVNTVHIVGLEFIDEPSVHAAIDAVLATKRYSFFPSRHQLFVDTHAIRESLERSFAFSEVRVGKSGSMIEVSVRERPTGVYVTDGKHSVFTDLQGMVVREATEGERAMVGESATSLPFLLLFIESELLTKPGERLFPDVLMPNYQSLKLRFETETGLPVHQYVLPRPNATWMKIKLADRREVFIDMTRESQPQVEKLLALMKAKGEELNSASVIDLRYRDRVYTK